ncbi:MAG: hypothetical protein Q9M97_06170 [Candidatus Gracilibacteria bacterium]|nr:hypothetical protein [Candidatus Gracilibacteria bacterium]
MAEILGIDRNTVSVYLNNIKISENKCLDFLEKKEKLILDSVECKINEEKEYEEKYLLMQNELSYFNAKIPEKYLCNLLDLKLTTLMSYKTGKIKKININEFLEKISIIKNNYLENIKNIKNNFIFLGKIVNIVEVCDFLKIPSATYYSFIDGGNLKYKQVEYVLENIDLLLDKYPKNLDEYIKELNNVKIFLKNIRNNGITKKTIFKKYKIS